MSKKPDGPRSAVYPRRDRKRSLSQSLRPPVIGIEAEFTLYVQEEKCLPEHIFRSPQQIVREKMIPRTGRSYHLPSGGALYFDTGVIEVATPIIELESGCCARAVRSLWEQIGFLRKELDAWETNHCSRVRLEGFSTHYNISAPPGPAFDAAGLRHLALLLTYVLHAPVMLLATNKLSTGVGVRPRERRMEVTVDFTPDPDLMAAATAFIVGAIRAVCACPDFSLSELSRRGIPVIAGFRPRKHTSRKGYLARADCFPQNPFASDPNESLWPLTDGRTVSLRQMAMEIAAPFRSSMLAVSDAESVDHVFAILKGRARSLLDFAERPAQYEDAGRVIDWKRRELHDLPRSRYEQVIQRIITHRPIRVGASTYAPERMHGWYEVLFRDTITGRRRLFTLDDLVRHCAV